MRFYFVVLLGFYFMSTSVGQELIVDGKGIYFSPPCGTQCHHLKFDEPGECPVCGMTLVTRSQPNPIPGYSKRIVKIYHNNLVLNTAYYLPRKRENKLAAAIIAHGSAPTSHEDVRFYTGLATRLGMAVAAFDKRGVGESGGKFEYFSVARSQGWFTLLASDIVAIATWLKQQPEINAAKIGLLGGSQAGWIMPLAASIDNSFAFIISGEGAAVSTGEEHYFSHLTGDGSPGTLSIKDADKKMANFSGDLGSIPDPF